MYKLWAVGTKLYKIEATAKLCGVWDLIDVKPCVLGLTNQTPSFLLKNPSGMLPLLEATDADGKAVHIAESNAICRFIAHQAIVDNVNATDVAYPRNLAQRAVVDAWLDWSNEVFAVMWQIGAATFGMAKGPGGVLKQQDADGRRQALELFAHIESKLTSATYLCGDRLTMADVVCYAELTCLFVVFFSRKERSKFPHTIRWMATVSACPSVAEAMPQFASAARAENDDKVYRFTPNPKSNPWGKSEANPMGWIWPDVFGDAKWTSANIRQAYLDFFEARAHSLVPSSAVVPHDDPTLLFANAGMNQFKPIFLGKADPSSMLGRLSRATNTQKCIRAGGKHNDLDDVGKDTYHHTFFEMLGNWSFGDYFKAEAIGWAWELLTTVFKIPEDRLYATYFGGKKEAGLEPDMEAREIWLKYLPASRVMPFDAKDNFWEMGDTGPCGPCTEVHFDLVGGRDAASLVNMDDPTCIEIWNLVFIQYNREGDGSLKPLPSKHVDTGMGFERIVCVLQNKMSNYDTDVFMPLFAAIERLTNAPRPYQGKLGLEEDPQSIDMAYRVIADHIRTLAISIADGARPGNEGREYVLRRVLRRAVRYGRETLKAPEGFFSKLVPVVVDLMANTFPELAKSQAKIIEVIADEEASFGRTLTKGIERFKKASQQVTMVRRLSSVGKDPKGKEGKEGKGGKGSEAAAAAAVAASQGTGKSGKAMLSGAEAFTLWDTFGFPVDLTQLMAEEHGLDVDMEGFHAAMAAAKEKSRAGGKGGAKKGGLKFEAEQTAHLRTTLGLAATDDSPKFLPPEERKGKGKGGGKFGGKVCAILAGESAFVDSAAQTEGLCALVMDRTSFYAEQGGQVADHGTIEFGGEGGGGGGGGGALFAVSDVKLAAGFVFHVGTVSQGVVRVGMQGFTCVDYVRRAKILPNHTFTHVLNYALKTHLGEDVNQKGSLVDAEKLRFDFSNNSAVKPAALAKIEADVVACIGARMDVYAKVVPLEDAKAINGLRAVFGEAYPDPVRVVSIGKSVEAIMADPKNADNAKYSIEFCGGIHVSNTADVAAFALLSEEGIAKGVRRIVAVTGEVAAEAIALGKALEARADALGALTDRGALDAGLSSLKGEVDRATIPIVTKQAIRTKLAAESKKLVELAKKAAGENKKRAVASAVDFVRKAAGEGMRACVLKIDVGLDSKALLEAVETALKEEPSMSLILFSAGVEKKKSKVMAYAGVSKEAVDAGLDAPTWIKGSLAVCGGKGGGKPMRAQGQAANVDKVDQAIAAAQKMGQEAMPAKAS